MEQGGPVLQSCGDLRHREHRPGLVVHQHDADQGRVLPDGVQHGLRRDVPLSIRLHIGSGVAFPLQLLDALEYGAVLHRRGNDVLPHAAVLVQRRADGPVVALRAAGGEKQLLGFAAQRSGDGFPAPVRQGFGLPAQGVLGGGVAVSLPHHMQGQISHFRQNLGGGCIVKINLLHS